MSIWLITTNVFRPAPEPGMLHAGSKGVAVYKLICCLAVAVEPGERQMGNSEPCAM